MFFFIQITLVVLIAKHLILILKRHLILLFSRQTEQKIDGLKDRHKPNKAMSLQLFF